MQLAHGDGIGAQALHFSGLKLKRVGQVPREKHVAPLSSMGREAAGGLRGSGQADSWDEMAVARLAGLGSRRG